VEERVLGIGFIDAMRNGTTRDFVGNDWLTDMEDRLSFWWAPIGYRDANRYLDVAERAIAESETTPERATAVSMPEPDSEGLFYPVTRALGLGYEKVFAQLAQAVAVQRLARVVMALLEHRQRERAWPESLAALGEMPLDPFGGKQFLYERTDRGCRVSSKRALGQPDELAEDDFLLYILDDDQMPAMAR
jgi:hypothetical protein